MTTIFQAIDPESNFGMCESSLGFQRLQFLHDIGLYVVADLEGAGAEMAVRIRAEKYPRAILAGGDFADSGDGFVDKLADVGRQFGIVRAGRHACGARRALALPGTNDAVSGSLRTSAGICRVI